MPTHPFDKGCTPQPFTIWSGHPNGQGWDAPNPSRFGAAPKNGQGLDPRTLHLHDFERLLNGQGLDPPTLHDLERLLQKVAPPPPNPSRFGAAPKWTRIGPPQPFTIWSGSQMDKDWTLTQSPVLLPALASIASQKAHCFFQHPPGQPHRKPT